ncbi:MAG: 7-carboxy-7-deazaguanine synthase QueE [Verrucomicrobiota bacterium]
MLISEIFYSIQGEGGLTGVPSVFVRASGCNLRCRWCDTPYASWNPEGIQMSVEEIVSEIEKHPTRFVVLTGGEPMVAREIHHLAEQLRGRGKHITIETAGTIPPEGIQCDLASLSPKLSNSTPAADAIDPVWIDRHQLTRRQPDVLRQWVGHCDYQFKFVVSDPADLAEIESTVASIGVPIPPWKIQLMPEGTTDEELRSRRGNLLAICLDRGYRYCDRLHIHLFGNTRGT